MCAAVRVVRAEVRTTCGVMRADVTGRMRAVRGHVSVERMRAVRGHASVGRMRAVRGHVGAEAWVPAARARAVVARARGAVAAGGHSQDHVCRGLG